MCITYPSKFVTYTHESYILTQKSSIVFMNMCNMCEHTKMQIWCKEIIVIQILTCQYVYTKMISYYNVMAKMHFQHGIGSNISIKIDKVFVYIFYCNVIIRFNCLYLYRSYPKFYIKINVYLLGNRKFGLVLFKWLISFYWSTLIGIRVLNTWSLLYIILVHKYTLRDCIICMHNNMTNPYFLSGTNVKRKFLLRIKLSWYWGKIGMYTFNNALPLNVRIKIMSKPFSSCIFF